MQKFEQVKFVGYDATGRCKKATVKSISARDAYEAGDAIKALFPKYEFNVHIIFGARKIASGLSEVLQNATNAGREES